VNVEVTEWEPAQSLPSRGRVTSSSHAHRPVEKKGPISKQIKLWKQQKYGHGSRRGPRSIICWRGPAAIYSTETVADVEHRLSCVYLGLSRKKWQASTSITSRPLSFKSTPSHYSLIILPFFFFLILDCEAIGTAATPGLLCQPRVIVKMIVEK
jgi:hypothetical protein